ncbi:uncharacterized protein LOC114812814 isoform X2 [Ornithorhynchus anatinus]|uniref:uncharacterized protein LOC114812814 isoform X2 n=1 Tax=Ornithorhynchus anatinus TaxID=9258 RepID=UPI0019D481D6|nr:uncharacterized protein LOC114812814 isoform X2 [Ornithorhynchus anatinus]
MDFQLSSCSSWFTIPSYSAGFSQASLIENCQISLTGTVGRSVLLPFAFGLKTPLPNPLFVKWHFSEKEILGSFTGQNCSISADCGNLIHCAEKRFFQGPHYQGRVELFPENFSLLLPDLRLNDSGIYTVRTNNVIMKINLSVFATVTEPPDTSRSTGKNNDNPDFGALIGVIIIASCCVFILLPLLILFLIRKMRERAQKVKENRIIQQLQMSRPERHCLTTQPLSLSTVYAEVSRTQGHEPSTLDPFPIYSSLQVPERQARSRAQKEQHFQGPH